MKKSPFKQRKKQLFVATEGMYTGQFVYCGKKGEHYTSDVLSDYELCVYCHH